MFCSKCGSKNVDEAKFCTKCGAKLQTNNTDKNIPNANIEEKSSRKVVYKGELLKCPNCGENLKSFESICPTCGHEFRSSKISSTLEFFFQEMQLLEAKRMKKGKGRLLVESLSFGTIEDIDKQIINLIKNFIVPNNSEDLFEFLIFACSNINVKLALEDFSNFDENEINYIKAINDIWMKKAKQVYQKASLSSKNHPKFSDIESIYLNLINEINEKKEIKKTKEKKIIKILIFFAGIPIIVFLLMGAVELFKKIPDPKLTVPFSSLEYVGKNYEEVILSFEDTGFVNLVMNEIEISLNESSKSHGEVVQISFKGVTNFDSQAEFASSTKIEITYYVIKYTINIRVEFESNLIFSRYDVNLMVNGTKKGEIKHGTSLDFRLRIRAGENMLTFVNTQDSNVNGSIKITVESDLDVTYKIAAFNDKVTIENITIQIFNSIPKLSININEKQEIIYFNRRIIDNGHF